MGESWIRSRGGRFLAGAALSLCCLQAEARELQILKKEIVRVRAWPLTSGSPEERRTLDAGDGLSPKVEWTLPWPGSFDQSRLVLRATRIATPEETERKVRLESELTTPGGQTLRASRVLAFGESTSALFDVARLDGRPLTLAIEAEHVLKLVPSPPPTVGRPVQFHIEILRVFGEQAISLETNRLSTFVNEPVAYSFRLGEPGVAESVQLQLLPVSVVGDMIRVALDVSATLPGEGGEPLLFSRNEQWAMTRGAGSSFTLATGDPATGFRFVVTPRF